MATGSQPRPRHATPASPRGRLVMPPEVEKAVAREARERPMTDAARQRLIDAFSLQYYFGGQVVAYRDAGAGVEVVAVGLEEIGKVLDGLPPAERQAIIIDHPDPW